MNGSHLHLLLAPLLFAACGSSKSTPQVNVPAKCREVEDTVCRSNATCAVAVGQVPSAQLEAVVADCKGGFSTTLNCAAQTTITGDPSVCETDISAMPCDLYSQSTGLPLPASCHGLFR